MKTRQELLGEAEELIVKSVDSASIEAAKTKLLYAIACVMLAKERREGEQAPTCEQVGQMVDAINAVAGAVRNA